MTEIATVGPSSGALALRADQMQFNEQQHAALAQLGVADAPAGDLAVFMHVAQRTGLDPFSRQIYMISRYDSQAGRNRWTIQTGIDGFRIIAGRSGVYRGQVGPEWCGEDGEWRDVWLARQSPIAARVGVLRSDFDQPIYGVAIFREYAQTKKGGDLTSMWASKGALMIAKCAEALALRKAFPHDLSGLMTPEETDRDDVPRQRRDTVVDAEPVTAQELTGGTPVPSGAEVGGKATSDQMKKLFASIREAGIENRNEWATGLLGRDITSFGQLTVADASHLIDTVERGLAAIADDEAAEQ